MLPFIRLICILLTLALFALALFRIVWTDFRPFGPWSNMLSWEDGAGFGVLLVSWVVLALVAREPSKRRSVIALSVGVLLAIVSYGAGFGISLYLSNLNSERGIGLTRKPDADKIILGYHWLVPEQGGMVAKGDGAVVFMTKEEFAQAPRADTPDEFPVWTSPVTRKELPKVDEDKLNVLDRAKERARIGSDLKQFAKAHFNRSTGISRKAPINIEQLELGGRLSDAQRKDLQDGTYVWYFGWNPYVAQKAAVFDERIWAGLEWLTMHWCGLGLTVILYGILTLIRAKARK